MTLMDDKTEHSHFDTGASRMGKQITSVRKHTAVFNSLVLSGVVLICIFLLSLFSFVNQVTTLPLPYKTGADAIVVLTGGTDRVEQAIKLLAEGRARRLLISGVHPGTTERQLAIRTASDRALFECCIDLDRLALDTAGNAMETAAWVKEHGYTSLLLVTSAYHIPRAKAELGYVLPHVELTPYPIYAAGLRFQEWYLQPNLMRLLIGEYMKYLFVQVKLSIRELISFAV